MIWQRKGKNDDFTRGSICIAEKNTISSHGYGITVGCGATIDVEPTREMEKVLFAADELTGLIWAAARDETFEKHEGHGNEVS